MMLSIAFTTEGFRDYEYWQTKDKKTLKKINDLLYDISRNGASQGIGKPEALKGRSGVWSRRINLTDRLIYIVKDDFVFVLACRYHYGDK